MFDALLIGVSDGLETCVAGPPGFEPRTSGSEGPGLINNVSSRNHKLETTCKDDYQP